MSKPIVGDSHETAVSAQPVAESTRGSREMEKKVADRPTIEGLFVNVMAILREMGYHSLSVERSEDFTERIDVVLTRQLGGEELGNSGYLRILTVYRIGEKLHIEVYNFLSKFPADNIEMGEVKQALENRFGKNPRIRMEIHE
jgi:hypothetical protein